MNYRIRACYNRGWPLALFVLFYGFQATGQGKFIQNIGQWNDTVVSKAEIRGASIFLCRNQVRYNFLNAKDIEPLHSDPYMLDTHSVHCQSFFMQWLNANRAVSIS